MENFQDVSRTTNTKGLKLPVIGDSKTSVLSLSTMGMVTFPVVVDLLSIYQNNDVLKMIQDEKIIDVDQLSLAILKNDVFTSLEFITAIAWFDKLIRLDDDAQALNLKGRSVRNESLPNFYLRVFKSDPESFVQMVCDLRLKNSAKMTSYKLFSPLQRLGRGGIAISKITKEQVALMEKMCQEHFYGSEYGVFAGVFKYEREGIIGFFIQRAGYKRSKNYINDNDKPDEYCGRNLINDVVFFDITSKTIWVSCRSNKDASFYVAKLQEILFGPGVSFTVKVAMDFKFLQVESLRELVQDYQSDSVEGLVFAKAHHKSFGINGETGVLSNSKLGEDCLTDAQFTKFHALRKTGKAINKLEIALKMQEDDEIYEDLELARDRVRFSDNLASAEIVYILNHLGALRGYADA